MVNIYVNTIRRAKTIAKKSKKKQLSKNQDLHFHEEKESVQDKNKTKGTGIPGRETL
jgi:hypothetical protein